MGIMAKGNVLLDGTIHVPAEHLSAVQPLLEDHITKTRAEPGCLSFSVTQDSATPGRFIVAEVFVDQAAFDAHQARVKSSDWGVFTKGFLRIYETKTLD